MTPVVGADGNLIATIGVFYSHRYEPTRRELLLVQTAASLVAVAVEHASARMQLSSLADAAHQMNSSLCVEELLQVVADIARDLVGAHVAIGVLRSNDAGGVELCKISHSEKHPNVVPSASLLGSAIRVALVTASGGESGALYVADKRAGEFVQNDRRVLAQLADLAAVGLEKARLNTEIEARVRRRTQDLQDSNRELEAFSYSVSHDLRGPLRAIAGFTGLLRDQHYETIDADGRRCIDRVLAGTQRMSNLIDDLLELGRVTRVEIRRRRVDLSEYARAILARLREAAPERAAATVIEPQVWVEGDPGLLEIALENLLDNAWKFTAGRPLAEIRFGACRAAGREPGRNDGERTVFVQDNGVGFDPRYAANLFGVPGSGVGLATVQRIVQRHGGRIWAEAGVDRGATIYFTIAKGQQ